MLTVILLNQDGAEPLENQVVLLTFFQQGQGWSVPQRTNERGEAFFRLSSVEGIIYINGSPVYQGHLGNSSVFYLFPEQMIDPPGMVRVDALDQWWKKARPQVQYEDETAEAVERVLVVPSPPQLQENYLEALVAGE